MKKSNNIFLAGHNGMLGRALHRSLIKKGYNNIITANKKNLDLRNEILVKNFFKNNKIDNVIIAAAKVGGIYANDTYPADFITDNLRIQTNLIRLSCEFSIEKLIFIGSCCIYPKECPQPMKEGHLLSGKLEPSNEGYALAKISGISMCQSFYKQYGLKSFCPMPINLYGPYDNFHPMNSHIIPGLIHRIHQSKIKKQKTTTLWGSGLPKREFMHVDDCADAILFANKFVNDGSIINIGPGKELTTLQTAKKISSIVKYKGQINLDSSKLDGTMRKKVDSTKLKKMGWKPKITFEKGLKDTYSWYLNNVKNK